MNLMTVAGSVGFVLADPVTQGLVMHAQLTRELPDHRFRIRLAIQAHGTGPYLGGVLPRCCHGCLRHDGYERFAAGRPGQLEAYRDVRAEAPSGAILTPELLSRWNGRTRQIPAPQVRHGPAFAKGGRERYGLHADTPQQFAACIAQATDQSIPVTARAARTHLDVSFFHPFDDANGRLAGLALMFVLLREQVELGEVAPLLTVVRRADDPAGGSDGPLLHGIATATHRRSRTPQSHQNRLCRKALDGRSSEGE